MLIGYNGSMFRAMSLAAVVAVVAALVGCHSAVEQLDHEVAQIIRKRQALALNQVTYDGLEGDADAQGAPPRRLYAQKPPTTNPPSELLPAEADRTVVEIDPDALEFEPPQPPDAAEMALEDIIGYAIEHAPVYRNEKESLYLTVLSLIAERHLWGPRFFDTVTASVDGTPERGDFDTVFGLVNEFSVTQRLPYGGEVGVTALVDYVNYLEQSTTGTPPTFDESTSSGVTASIDLPLLRGAGMAAREDLIQAERDVIYAVRDFERFRREFLVQIANDYFDLIRQQQALVNQRYQMQNFKRLADRTRALAEAGRIPPFDAENTAQQLLFSYNNLINAEENYQAAVDAFKLQIGFPTSADLLIVPQEIDVPAPQLDSSVAVLTAWDLRLDLQTARDQVDDARRLVKVARNDVLPDLDLFAEVSASSASAGRDFDNLQLDEGGYTAGASLSLPLDRRIEWTRVRRTQVELEREKRDYQLFRDQIALQVRRSVRTIEQSRLSVVLQERNVELAQRRVQALELREREVEPRDMIDAQEDLLEARNRLDSARADLRSSILQYLLDTGQMRVGPDGSWLAPGRLTQMPMPQPPPGDVSPPGGMEIEGLGS